MEAIVASRRVLDAGPAASGARNRARLHLALGRRRPTVRAAVDRAVALVAARTGAGHPDRAVPGPDLATAGLRAVRLPEHRLSIDGRVPARTRAGACAVRRLLRQHPRGDGHAGHAGTLRPQAGHAGGGVVRIRRDPAGGGDAGVRRSDAGWHGLAGGRSRRLAGGAGTVADPHRADLSLATPGREAGMIEFYPQIK